MSADYGKTLMLHRAELAVLLEGCDIRGLLLPPNLAEAVGEELDLAQAMAGMARDGLMVKAEDGLLDYEPTLRQALVALRDSVVTLLVRSSDEDLVPLLLHVGQGDGPAVLVHEDTLREDMVCVSVLPTARAYDELAALMEGGVVLEGADAGRLADLQALAGNEGTLFMLEGFVRGSEQPTSTAFVLKPNQAEADEPASDSLDASDLLAEDAPAQGPELDASFVQTFVERCRES